MLDHHLQKKIVYRLAFATSLRFSELKPPDIDSKLFTYHLHKVEKAGLVHKNDQGLYTLTPEGRRVGVQVFTKQQVLIDQAYSVLLLLVWRPQDGAWLLCKRKTYPLLDYVGFTTAIPVDNEPSTMTAKNTLLTKTGLTVEFEYRGSGYLRLYEQESLESFIHFTLLVAEDVEGELTVNDELNDYYWDEQPDFASSTMLPSMPVLVEQYQTGKIFFIEKTLKI